VPVLCTERPEKYVPTGFVKPRWRPHVFPASGIGRHFDELCALAELRDRLRSGDILEWLGEPEPKGPGLAKPSVKQQLAAPRCACCLNGWLSATSWT
jgi:hypothetical protein